MQMNAANTLGRRLALAAAITLSGFYWSAVGAAVVHGASTDAIEHSYGRAGGLVGAEEVSEPATWEGSPPVAVSFSADLAQWTNMPRSQAQEGPVKDSSDAPASSEHAFIEHWYGRAGGLTGSDMVSGPKTWAPPLGGRADNQ